MAVLTPGAGPGEPDLTTFDVSRVADLSAAIVGPPTIRQAFVLRDMLIRAWSDPDAGRRHMEQEVFRAWVTAAGRMAREGLAGIDARAVLEQLRAGWHVTADVPALRRWTEELDRVHTTVLAVHNGCALREQSAHALVEAGLGLGQGVGSEAIVMPDPDVENAWVEQVIRQWDDLVEEGSAADINAAPSWWFDAFREESFPSPLWFHDHSALLRLSIAAFPEMASWWSNHAEEVREQIRRREAARRSVDSQRSSSGSGVGALASRRVPAIPSSTSSKSTVGNPLVGVGQWDYINGRINR